MPGHGKYRDRPGAGISRHQKSGAGEWRSSFAEPGGLRLGLTVPEVTGKTTDIHDLAVFMKQVRAAPVHKYRVDMAGLKVATPLSIVLLGALFRWLESQDVDILIPTPSIPPRTAEVLRQTGFLSAFRLGPPVGRGSTIRYREDAHHDPNSIIDYLKTDLLSRNFLAIPEVSQSTIAGALGEIYQNAFDHAESPVGVISCGQYDKNSKIAELAAVDLGVGIPGNVRRHFRRLRRTRPSGEEAMQWAMEPGHTTKPLNISRGNGLTLLTDLVTRYRGWLEIRSHDGRVIVRDGHVTFQPAGVGISGTLIRVRLRCDTEPFDLGQPDDRPLF